MSKTERKIMLTALLAGVIFWCGDAIGDYFSKFNQTQPFLTVLFYDAPTHEFFIRPFVVLLFLSFGIATCIFLRRIKESEGSYQEIFENVHDGIFVKPLDRNKAKGGTKFVEVNSLACRMLGYNRAELLELSPLEITDPAQADQLTSQMEKIWTKGAAVFESTLVRKDGGKLLAEVSIRAFKLHGKPMALALVRDITARKQAGEALRESERQLRSLTARLLEVQEVERGRISQELHDELGQSLMWEKIQISSIRDRLPQRQSALRNDCDTLLDHLGNTIENVRRLSYDLKPWGLEELGFPLAAKFLIEESCKLYGIPSCLVDLDNVEGLFSPEAQLNIYRIIQESMTNIGKHSQATEVSAEIRSQDGQIMIRIEDNGLGFDPKKFRGGEAERRGVGLAAMQERARILRGQVEIESQEGSGTSITLRIPGNSLAAAAERS